MGHWIGVGITLIVLAGLGALMVLWIWRVTSAVYKAALGKPHAGAAERPPISEDSAGL